jgi:hypothetical protein
MFDASPEATLARKYDAANERSLYRALKEFREVQGETPEIEAAQQLAPCPIDELGSCLPEPPDPDLESTEVDPTPVEIAAEGPCRPDSGKSPRKRGRNRGLVVDRDVPDRRSSTLD